MNGLGSVSDGTFGRSRPHKVTGFEFHGAKQGLTHPAEIFDFVTDLGNLRADEITSMYCTEVCAWGGKWRMQTSSVISVTQGYGLVPPFVLPRE